MQTMTLCSRGVVRRRRRIGMPPASMPSSRRRRVDVGQQPRAKRRIDPGPGHQPGAVGRAAAVDGLERAAQLVGREHALGLQQGGHRLGQRHVAGERRVLEVRPVRMRDRARARSRPAPPPQARARARTGRRPRASRAGAGIVRPELRLREPHAVDRQGRQSVPAVGQLLRVGLPIGDPQHRRRAAAGVERRPAMAGRVQRLDPHPAAVGEAARSCAAPRLGMPRAGPRPRRHPARAPRAHPSRAAGC